MELAESGETDDISATRFESSYLHLDKELPEVAVISELEVYGRNYWMSDDLTCDPRFISGDAAARLIERLPRLRRAHLQLSDEESRNIALRERERERKMIRPKSLVLLSLLTIHLLRLRPSSNSDTVLIAPALQVKVSRLDA